MRAKEEQEGNSVKRDRLCGFVIAGVGLCCMLPQGRTAVISMFESPSTSKNGACRIAFISWKEKRKWLFTWSTIYALSSAVLTFITHSR